LGKLRFVRNRRIETDSASRMAIGLADRVADGSINGDGLDEQVVFGALQTCAYRALRSARRGRPGRKHAEAWGERWKLIRDHIFERNIGLVYSMIGRFSMKDVDLDEQRSEALLALMHAVEGFNPWRDIRFSTYACSAISHALIHLSKRTARYRDRFLVEGEVWQDSTTEVEGSSDLFTDRLRQALDSNQADLTDREAAVLGWRFPREGGRTLTFAEIGKAIGLSRERARQIQERALVKLRDVLQADPVLQ
jgi:RNA polymerase sigma factor (sigma-70 family)